MANNLNNKSKRLDNVMIKYYSYWKIIISVVKLLPDNAAISSLDQVNKTIMGLP
jgi:hypothetical protein